MPEFIWMTSIDLSNERIAELDSEIKRRISCGYVTQEGLDSLDLEELIRQKVRDIYMVVKNKE